MERTCQQALIVCRDAHAVLLRARIYGEETGDLWEFSLSQDEMRALGLHTVDIKYLLMTKLLDHKLEAPGDSSCAFVAVADPLELEHNSRFILTEKGRAMGVRDVPSDIEEKPGWDCDRRELRFKGRLIKRFQCPAKNQITILSAFEEETWPVRIDDPLPPSANTNRKTKLRDTIKALNQNHATSP